MFSIFVFAVNAIFPIILLILLGYFLKRIRFFSDDFLTSANKFVFHVALPVLLFYNVYEIDDLSSIEWNTVIFAEAVILILFAIGFVCVKLFIKDDRQKGVVLQSFFRSNYALIGFPLSEALGGAECLGITAVISAFAIPTFNILAVISLSIFTGADAGKKISLKSTIKKIAKNPLILGVLAGLIVLFIRGFIPTDANGEPVFSIAGNLTFLFDAIAALSKIASPLALIVLGGQFSFKAVRGLFPQIAFGTIVRTIAAPVFALTAAVLISRYTSFLNFGTSHYSSLIALYGSPIAVSSAIMANEMDNDGELAGQLVVWTSIMSVFTLFGIIVTLKAAGLL